jgi:DNA-binding NarL/FixJ family response regulator
MPSVLIADDFELMRRNLCNLLAKMSDIAVCGEAGDYAELLKQLDATKPDVVLMDIRMPYSGEGEIEETRNRLRGACLIAMSFATGQEIADIAQRLGAMVLLDKVNLASTLIPAIKECMKQKQGTAAS